MEPTLCARCHKNVAVIFVTKIENGKTTSEGLCLKCARELGMKPVDDMMQKMGITDDDIEGIAGEMLQAFGGAEEVPTDVDGDEEEDRHLPLPGEALRRAGRRRGKRRRRRKRRPVRRTGRRTGEAHPRPGQEAQIPGHLLHLPHQPRPGGEA